MCLSSSAWQVESQPNINKRRDDSKTADYNTLQMLQLHHYRYLWYSTILTISVVDPGQADSFGSGSRKIILDPDGIPNKVFTQ